MGKIRIEVTVDGGGAIYECDQPEALTAFMAFYPTVKGKDTKVIKQEWFNALDASMYCGVSRRLPLGSSAS